MSLIESPKLGQNSFLFYFDDKTYEQHWERFHAHQGLEFLYIEQGNGNIIIDQKIYQIKPKTLVCFQPFQLHRIKILSTPQNPYIRTTFIVEPRFVEQFIQPFSSLYSLFKYLCEGKLEQQLFSIGDCDQLHAMLSEFNQRIETVNSNNWREELVLFLIFLLLKLRNIAPGIDEQTLEPKRYIRHVENIMNWIDKHYHEDLSLDLLALDMHLSPYHISHIFHEEMGCTITSFLTVKRLKEACLLLSSTDLSISAISKKIGLKNESYFSHLFKRNIGMTPQQYRNSQQNLFNNY